MPSARFRMAIHLHRKEVFKYLNLQILNLILIILSILCYLMKRK